jgi:hypothetical protein
VDGHVEALPSHEGLTGGILPRQAASRHTTISRQYTAVREEWLFAACISRPQRRHSEITFRRMASHANFPVQRHSELGGFLIE